MAYVLELIVTVFVEFLWGNVFSFIGALVRWIFGSIWRLITGKPRLPFAEYNKKAERSTGFTALIYESKNSIIGLLFTAAVVAAIIFLKRAA